MRTLRMPLAAVMVVTALAALALSLNQQTIAAHPTSDPPQQGSAPVTIVNPLPLPVRDVNDSGRTPVQFDFVPGFPDYVVPSDKRLVIEFVSGLCQTEIPGRKTGAFITTTVGSLSVGHVFIPVLTGSSPDSNFQVFSQATRLYADPGTEVHATVPSIGGGGPCSSVAFSGYLTNP